MLQCSPLKFDIHDISYTIFYAKFIYILFKFYPIRSFDYNWKNKFIMFWYKRNICFILENFFFFFVIESLSSEHQFNKYWQTYFNAVFSDVETTPMNIRWLNFPFQPNINVETRLSHQHWIDVTLSSLFQRCFSNAETTPINERRLNFHF